MKRRDLHILSHTRNITLQGGMFMPIGCVEILPGDDISHSISCLIRATPQLAPIIQPTMCYVETYFVPNRLVMEDWEEFIAGETATIPVCIYNNGNAGDDALFEAMGVGQVQSVDDNAYSMNSMMLRGYNAIWNTYVMDQDLQTELPVLDAAEGDFDIRRVAWARDPYTTARLTPQKGTAVTIPIGGTAPIVFPSGIFVDQGGTAGDPDLYGNIQVNNTASPGANVSMSAPGALSNMRLTGDGPINAIADLSLATSVPVTDLRFATRLQQQRERRMRYGSRYEDILLSDFGQKSRDSRLQQPEFLGGGKQLINWSEVLNTSTADSGVVGEMFGHGIGTTRSHRYRYHAEEHGYLISVMYIRPSSLYTTVTPKHFFKNALEEYFFKDFENVGQQPIMLKEIYPGDDDSFTEVFGYRDRYDEYRHQPNQVSREFITTLNFWHFGRIFGTSKPVLNSSFITCTPTNRVFADTSDSTDKYWVHVQHNLKARRVVSRNAAPHM